MSRTKKAVVVGVALVASTAILTLLLLDRSTLPGMWYSWRARVGDATERAAAIDALVELRHPLALEALILAHAQHGDPIYDRLMRLAADDRSEVVDRLVGIALNTKLANDRRTLSIDHLATLGAGFLNAQEALKSLSKSSDPDIAGAAQVALRQLESRLVADAGITFGMVVTEKGSGVEVVECNSETAASRASLRRGDRITHINGHETSTLNDMAQVTRGIRPTELVEFSLLRDASKLEKFLIPDVR